MREPANALVVRRPGQAALERVVLSGSLGEDEVLLRPRFAGLCGIDAVHAETARSPCPAVLGTELLAIVEETGASVEGFKSGEAVLVLPPLPCGACEQCNSGYVDACATVHAEMARPGLSIEDEHGVAVPRASFVGGFSELTFARESQLIAMPMRIRQSPAGCMLAGTGLRGAASTMALAGLFDSPRVAIYGCGGVGCSALLGARANGWHPTVVESHAGRREFANRLAGVPAGSETIDLDPGTFDLVVESTSTFKAINGALRLTRHGGMCVPLSSPSYDGRLSVDLRGITASQRTLAPPRVTKEDRARWIHRLVELDTAGSVQFDPIVDTIIDHAEIPQHLRQFEKRDYVKAVVEYVGVG